MRRDRENDGTRPSKSGDRNAPPGHRSRESGGFVKEILALPNLEIEGVYTHFANIEDTLDPTFAQFQIEEFRRALAIVKEAGAQPVLDSCVGYQRSAALSRERDST